MAKATSQHPAGQPFDPGASVDGPENLGLLSAEAEAALFEPSDDEDIPLSPPHIETQGTAPATAAPAPAPAPAEAQAETAGTNGRVKPAVRIASTSPPGPERTPRTPQRVRFDPNPTILHGLTPNGTATSFDTSRDSRRSFDDDDDNDDNDDDNDHDGRGHGHGHRGRRDDSLDDLDFQVDDDDDEGRQHRRPLLTGIEAPAVALANSPWGGEYDDVHSWAEAERSRPKSGLKSAFMNMANSIIGAGIIGQPYAFKQAGLLSGIILLVGLTIVVDWTICLIVVNSKLSGANSFQGTVEKCFGKSGLIAISLAQWLFAFGGMVAFGVIVGDTIPHVLQAVLPGLKDMPVLGLLADRRVVIVVFILGVSFPLTLYRDIAKVRRHFFPLDALYTYGQGPDLKTACKSQHSRLDEHDDHPRHSPHTGPHCALGGPWLLQHAASYHQ